MSTDSTELTFVRCPSCRSLVPAVSTRCRMCGATLDAGVKPEEEPKRSGRVRQRTMSQPHSQLSATASQIRQSLETGPEQESYETGFEAETEGAPDDAANDNPLGQYLQEEDQEPVVTAAAEESDDFLMEPAAGSEEDFETPPVAGKGDIAKHVAQNGEESRAKVTVESGPRQMGRPSSLSFSKPKEEAAPRADKGGRDRERQQQEARQPDPRRENDSRKEHDARRDKGPRGNFGGRDEERNARDSRRDNRPSDRSREADRSKEADRSRDEMRSDNRQPNRTPAAVHSAGGDRLVGWLVSFDEARGSAIELREGKFFVTGSSLKSSDLVIPGKDVSTPHALVSVSASQGIRIQDLMSESGLFVRRRQKGEYQREEGTVSVSHGDSVRFGDAEFNIALIDTSK